MLSRLYCFILLLILLFCVFIRRSRPTIYFRICLCRLNYIYKEEWGTEKKTNETEETRKNPYVSRDRRKCDRCLPNLLRDNFEMAHLSLP